MKKKAFAYLRVSGKAQVDGDGFPRQLAAIQTYAAQHDHKIVNVYREEGISGAKELENRPALQDLLGALYSNGVHTVIIEKLDRLARDLMVQETILGDMRKQGCELISVAEPDLCSDDPSRKLVRQMFGAISEYEKSMIVIKLRVARQRKKTATGRCEGKKPFGHFAGEMEIVTRIRTLRDEGMVLEKIASMLNDEGVPTRQGAQWYCSTIQKILKREEAAC